MKHQLSFATFTLLSDCIVEVVINSSTEITLEMVEEYDLFLAELFSGDFGLLVNKVHSYDFSFEAKLSIGSHENLKAIAVVSYSEQSERSTQDIVAIRKMDSLNLRIFSGLELGWQQAHDWLKKELSVS